MNTIILFILIYLSYLLIWFTINLVAFFLAIVTKRPSVFGWISGISQLILWILNFLVGIWLLVFDVGLLMGGQILGAIIFFFIGIGAILSFINWLQIPFIFIAAYFSEKVGSTDFNENVASAEILDKDNRVMAKLEGDTTISVRLAKYFLVFYAFNLAFMFLYPDRRRSYGLTDFITSPFLQIIGGTLIIGIPYLVYHKIRYHTFLPEDKRYFFISVWKLALIVFSFLAAVLSVIFRAELAA